MSERIKLLENEIRTSKLNKTTVGPFFRAILKGNTPELAKQRNQLIQVVTADNRARKEKESNVIVIGLAPSTAENDKESISRFFEATGLSVIVNHVQN
jgi:precorrin isomerase